VSEDCLFEELKEKLKDDFVPVKPLKEAWERALWILPVSLVFAAVTLVIFHLRPDYLNFHPLELYGFILLQILACYLALTVSLKTGIPGSFRSPVYLILTGLAGPLIFLVSSWINYDVSPNSPEAGHQLSTGAACLTIIGAFGLLALAAGFLLARSGLPFRSKSVGLLLGLAGGLAAEASWRLHCPFTGWDHILIFHGGALLILAAIGLAIGHFTRRRAGR